MKNRIPSPSSQKQDCFSAPKARCFLLSRISGNKVPFAIACALGGILLVTVVGCACFFAGKHFAQPKMNIQGTEPSLAEPVQAAAVSQPDPTPTEKTTVTEPAETTLSAATQTEPIQSTESTQSAFFEPYLFTVNVDYFDLPIYNQPSFQSVIVDYVTKTGVYTIVEEQTECLSNGCPTVWGKLKSGIGWINLIDAVGDYLPPLNCLDCRKSHQETSVSRYGYCDPCHEINGVADYGACEKCGWPIESVAATLYDGRRCFSCQFCDYCGSEIESWIFDKAGEYMCSDCYANIYLMVGNCYYCGAVCDVLAGACEECISASLPCMICGFACEPYDPDSICEDCYRKSCHYCGGPLSPDHNCDDYPNVICPNCGWGIHTTGVGINGWDCPECGTNIIPAAN